MTQCYYCGVRLTRKGTRRDSSSTVDHKIPLARGGDRSRENCVRCCRKCNGRKGSLTDAEFLRGRTPVIGSSLVSMFGASWT